MVLKKRYTHQCDDGPFEKASPVGFAVKVKLAEPGGFGIEAHNAGNIAPAPVAQGGGRYGAQRVRIKHVKTVRDEEPGAVAVFKPCILYRAKIVHAPRFG